MQYANYKIFAQSVLISILPRSREDLYTSPLKRLCKFSQHSHTIGDIIVLILTSNGVRTQHFHHSSVIAVTLVHTFIEEKAVFFDPCTVYNYFRLFVCSGKFGSDMSDAATLFNFLLYLFCDTSTSRV